VGTAVGSAVGVVVVVVVAVAVGVTATAELVVLGATALADTGALPEVGGSGTSTGAPVVGAGGTAVALAVVASVCPGRGAVALGPGVACGSSPHATAKMKSSDLEPKCCPMSDLRSEPLVLRMVGLPTTNQTWLAV